MGYVIVYKRNNKRVLKKGKLIPYFPYSAQAAKYIDYELNNSPYVKIKKV